jgi:sulfotransferase
MEKLFFQSSLPRAGSTLLQNIMGQNPDFYVTPTSGVLELVYAARTNYSDSPEFKAQDADIMKTAFLSFCGGGVHNFFEAITDKKYVIDKSRGWGVHYNFLNSFHPDPKIICMIRDPRAIMASMEKNFRKNQHLDSGLVNHAEMTGTTTEKRVDIWVSSQPVGLAMERLYQVVKEGIDEKMLFIKFENLTQNPKKEIEKVYNFLELPQFKHDFNNVEQITQEDDQVYGMYGDHTIKSKVEPVKKDYNQVLGTQAANWVKNNYKWFYDTFKYY